MHPALLKPSREASPARSVAAQRFRRGDRLRNWSIQLALIVGGVGAALVLAEIAVRTFPHAFGIHAPLDYYMPHVFAQDPEITWTLDPGARSPHQHFAGDYDVTVTIDPRGFRITPHAEGRPNLLVLGDSFTFGLGVQDRETYPSQLATKLPGWNVLNGGYVGGASLDTHFLWLRRNYPIYRPKFVIFQVFEANDYNEVAENVWQETDAQGVPAKILTKYQVKDGRSTLTYSHQSFTRRMAALIRRSSHIGFLLVNKVEVFYFLTLPKLLGQAQRNEDTTEMKEFADAAFEKISTIIGAIEAHSAKHGYQFGFVFVPRTYWTSGEKLHLYKAAIFEAHLRERGIRFHTLDRLWEEDAAKIHLPNDAHHTAYGNGVVAEELYRWLIKDFALRPAPDISGAEATE
jgi:hypothetical protein